MELPLYHLPSARTLAHFVWNNTRSFVEKAGSIILVASAAVWALSHLPTGDPASSVLAWVGQGLEPLGALMGLGDWRMLTALLTSFVAKENTIATLGVLFAGQALHGSLPVLVAAQLKPAAGLAFLVVQMLFIPCAATLSTLRHEAGWRWASMSVLLQLAISIAMGITVFQIASHVGYG
jgi:ferrous iron transport protein B